MPIIIDQMEVQPAPATPARAANPADGAASGAPPSEDQKQRDVLRALRIEHDRRARLRAY